MEKRSFHFGPAPERTTRQRVSYALPLLLFVGILTFNPAFLNRWGGASYLFFCLLPAIVAVLLSLVWRPAFAKNFSDRLFSSKGGVIRVDEESITRQVDNKEVNVQFAYVQSMIVERDVNMEISKIQLKHTQSLSLLVLQRVEAFEELANLLREHLPEESRYREIRHSISGFNPTANVVSLLVALVLLVWLIVLFDGPTLFQGTVVLAIIAIGPLVYNWFTHDRKVNVTVPEHVTTTGRSLIGLILLVAALILAYLLTDGLTDILGNDCSPFKKGDSGCVRLLDDSDTIVFLADGEHLLRADSRSLLIEPASQSNFFSRMLRTRRLLHAGTVVDFAVSGDKQRAIVSIMDEDELVLVAWDLEKRRQIQIDVPLPPIESTTSLALSHDGTYLALASGDQVEVWSVDEGLQILISEQSSAVAFSPAFSLVAIAQGAHIGLIDPGEPAGIQHLPIGDTFTDSIETLAFSNDGIQLAGMSKNRLAVWQLTDGHMTYTAESSVHLHRNLAAFTPDGNMLAMTTPRADAATSIHPHAEISIISLVDGSTVNNFSLDSFGFLFLGPNDIAISPNGDLLAVGSNHAVLFEIPEAQP